MNRRRSLTFVEIIAVVMLAACDSSNVSTGLKSPSAASELLKMDRERELTFMTYNVYQGTELENSTAATTPQEFVAGATREIGQIDTARGERHGDETQGDRAEHDRPKLTRQPPTRRGRDSR